MFNFFNIDFDIHHIAILFIIVLTAYFIGIDQKHKSSNPQFPSLLITVGIAFTFLGITLGLKDFNVDDPTSSLGSLISGIKTAFWGSLAGVIGSIIVKAHSLLFLNKNDNTKKLNEQIEQFYKDQTAIAEHSSYIKLLHTDSQKNNQNLIDAIKSVGIDIDTKNKEHTNEILQTVVKSLEGIENIQKNTQQTLVSEISLLRSEFTDFAKQQAEQNTEIFIEALSSAIKEFNQSLSTSLGENFKQLNLAVNNLVTWQDNYSEHVQMQTEKYSEIASQITVISSDFEKFIQSTSNFEVVLNQVESTLQSIDDKNSEFNNRIESFYSALDSKIIDFDKARSLLESGFKQVESQMQTTKETSQQIFNDLSNFIKTSTNETNKTQQLATQEVQKMTSSMLEAFDKTHKQLQENLTNLESKLESTLNQSLSTLGQQLGSLSSQFAKDYEPITLNLKNILDSLNKGTRH